MGILSSKQHEKVANSLTAQRAVRVGVTGIILLPDMKRKLLVSLYTFKCILKPTECETQPNSICTYYVFSLFPQFNKCDF